MEKIEVDQLSLWDDLLGPGMTAIVGAGGKTSLIQLMAHLSQAKAIPTVVTTTTKMYHQQLASWPLYVGEDLEGAQVFCQQAVSETGVAAWAGNLVEVGAGTQFLGVGLEPESAPDSFLGKVQGPRLEALCQLSQRQPSWQILIEADGARHKVLKAPKSTEPVIPSGTRQTIGVLNLSVLGQEASKDLVHNWDLFRSLLDIAERQPSRDGQPIVDEHPMANGRPIADCQTMEKGQPIDMPMLIDLVKSPRGLFQYSHGQKVLFCLACENLSEEALDQFVTMLANLGLDKIVLAHGWGSHIEIRRIVTC